MDRNRFKRDNSPAPTAATPTPATQYPAWNALSGAAAQPVAPPTEPPAPPVSTVTPAPPIELPPPPDVTIEIKLPSIKLPDLQLTSSLKRSAAAAKKVPMLAVPAVRSLGSLSRQAASRLRRASKRAALTAASISLIALGALIGLHQLSANRAGHQASAAAAIITGNKKATATLSSKPSYQPLVPKSEPGLAVPKLGVSAFDSSRSSYTFIDKFIAGSTIQVSEQPLPEQFSSASVAVDSVAKSIQATATTSTSYGAAFIATNERTNAQTIVFATSKLLVFIQSPFTHNPSDWQTYINNLK